MVTKYNKYFENYMSAGNDGPPRRTREPIPYKQVVMTFLSQDFKELMQKTKDSYDWDKFIDNCEKAEKLPYVCASNIKERILSNINKDIIKEVNPKLLDKKDKVKSTKPKERYLKPRPEVTGSFEEEKKPTKTVDYSDRNKDLYDGGPFGDDIFDDENYGSAYESIKVKFNEFLYESSDETITINFWGQYKGVFKKVNNGWKIVSGIFPDYIAKNIINDVDPEHDTEKRADIGVTYKGYGLSPYFSEFAGGGYSPNKSMVISDELFNELSDDYNESVNESIDNVEKLSDGRVKYRNEIFPGFNKPKKYSGKGKYKKRVLAKEGDKIKVINYGHSDYEDYTKHKDSERRKNFRARHGCDPVSDLSKLTAKYWACQDLW